MPRTCNVMRKLPSKCAGNLNLGINAAPHCSERKGTITINEPKVNEISSFWLLWKLKRILPRRNADFFYDLYTLSAFEPANSSGANAYSHLSSIFWLAKSQSKHSVKYEPNGSLTLSAVAHLAQSFFLTIFYLFASVWLFELRKESERVECCPNNGFNIWVAYHFGMWNCRETIRKPPRMPANRLNIGI